MKIYFVRNLLLQERRRSNSKNNRDTISTCVLNRLSLRNYLFFVYILIFFVPDTSRMIEDVLAFHWRGFKIPSISAQLPRRRFYSDIDSRSCFDDLLKAKRRVQNSFPVVRFREMIYYATERGGPRRDRAERDPTGLSIAVYPRVSIDDYPRHLYTRVSYRKLFTHIY